MSEQGFGGQGNHGCLGSLKEGEVGQPPELA